MIWKFLKQNVLFPKGLNWVQHCVSRIGLLARRREPAWDRSFQPAGVRVGRYTLILKHLHGNRVAAICLKWISATKVSKYGKSEYSRALNASYTFQPLMSFWYPNKDSNNRKIESARWTMEREGPRALSYFFAPASLQHQETSAEPLRGRETLTNFLVIRLCIIAACEAARGWFL